MELEAYVRAVRNSWWIVLICVVLGAGATFVRVEREPTTYAGHAMFYVSSSASSVSDQAAQNQADTFAGLLQSDLLANMVVSATKLKLEPTQVRDKITGSAALNTVLITATVKDSSRQQALVIATAVSTEFPKLITQLNKVGSKQAPVAAKLVSGPSVGSAPIAPRKKLDALLGALVGLVVGIAVAVMRQLFGEDSRVRSDTRRPAVAVSHDESQRVETATQLSPVRDSLDTLS